MQTKKGKVRITQNLDIAGRKPGETQGMSYRRRRVIHPREMG